MKFIGFDSYIKIMDFDSEDAAKVFINSSHPYNATYKIVRVII